MKFTTSFLQFSIIIGLVFLLSGCLVSAQGKHGGIIVAEDPVPRPTAKKTGPPAHAKAHGHRAKYQYHYYPDTSVYYDTGRSVYFYLNSSGAWRMTVSLPRSLQIRLGDNVTIQMESDRPYSEYYQHKKKYPSKNKKKHKRK